MELSRVNDPHTVAGLLKLYLRSLPDPLFSFSAYDSFISAHRSLLLFTLILIIIIIIIIFIINNYLFTSILLLLLLLLLLLFNLF